MREKQKQKHSARLAAGAAGRSEQGSSSRPGPDAADLLDATAYLGFALGKNAAARYRLARPSLGWVGLLFFGVRRMVRLNVSEVKLEIVPRFSTQKNHFGTVSYRDSRDRIHNQSVVMKVLASRGLYSGSGGHASRRRTAPW